MISDLRLATCAHGGQRRVREDGAANCAKVERGQKAPMRVNTAFRLTNALHKVKKTFRHHAIESKRCQATCAMTEVRTRLWSKSNLRQLTDLQQQVPPSCQGKGYLVQHNAQNFSRLKRTAFKTLAGCRLTRVPLSTLHGSSATHCVTHRETNRETHHETP